MENTIKYFSKPIDIINNKTNDFHTSYNTFIEYNYICPLSNNNSPNIKSNIKLSSNMKKTLSLDNFWPNTPPSFTPKKTILEKIKNILQKQ